MLFRSLAQRLRIDQVVQSADMNPAFLEVVEAVDDAPLIPSEAIQLRHHQFVAIHQGVERRLELGAILLRCSGTDGLLENHGAPCRFQGSNLGIGVLMGS